VLETIMDEQERRSLRELIGKAAAGDGTARAGVVDTIMAFDRAGRAEDVAFALEQVAAFGPPDLHQAITTRLQVDDHKRRDWPMIG
jgi:hypothetical protein